MRPAPLEVLREFLIEDVDMCDLRMTGFILRT
jgi:hypothetical protein